MESVWKKLGRFLVCYAVIPGVASIAGALCWILIQNLIPAIRRADAIQVGLTVLFTVLLYVLFRKKMDLCAMAKMNAGILLVLTAVYTGLMIAVSGSIEGSVFPSADWLIAPFAGILVPLRLMGRSVLLYLSVFLTYLAAWLSCLVLGGVKPKVGPALAVGSFLLLCLVTDLVLYTNRPAVRYGGHGFQYMHGYSSTDFSDYMVYSEPSKLVTLDHAPSLVIENEADMPILNGAEACYPVYAAAAKAVYRDIAAIEKNALDLEEYKYQNGRIVKFTNTVEGFESLIRGAGTYRIPSGTDMLFGARPSRDQLKRAKSENIALKITPIGREAFVFFVEKDNPVDGLTSEQVKAIYHGDITNWKEVGGKDQPIAAFQRPVNSGSQTMMEYFMGDLALKEPKTYEMVDAMAGVIKQVAQYANEDGALGYTFRYFLEGLQQEEGVKMLTIDGVSPTLDNIENGSYPLTTDLCLITRENDPNPNVQKMIDFMLSEDGQYIVHQTGYGRLPREEGTDPEARYTPDQLKSMNQQEALAFLKQLGIEKPEEAAGDSQWDEIVYQIFQESLDPSRKFGTYMLYSSMIVFTGDEIWSKVRHYVGWDSASEFLKARWDTLGLAEGETPGMLQEMLAQENAVVVRDGEILSGDAVWSQFCQLTQRGAEDELLLMKIFTLTGQRLTPELFEEEDPEYPQAYLYRIRFDGERYTVTVRKSDAKEPEEDGEQSFHFLYRLEGEEPKASHKRYVRYVLTDKENVSWEELAHGMFSSQHDDYIPFLRILYSSYDDLEWLEATYPNLSYPASEELPYWRTLSALERAGWQYKAADLETADRQMVFRGTAPDVRSLLGLGDEQRIFWQVPLPYILEDFAVFPDGILTCGPVSDPSESAETGKVYLERYSAGGERIWSRELSAAPMDLICAAENGGRTLAAFQFYDREKQAQYLRILHINEAGELIKETKMLLPSGYVADGVFDGEKLLLCITQPSGRKASLLLLGIDSEGEITGQIVMDDPEGRQWEKPYLFIWNGRLLLSASRRSFHQSFAADTAEGRALKAQWEDITKTYGTHIPGDVMTEFEKKTVHGILMEAKLPAEGLPPAESFTTVLVRPGCMGGPLSVNENAELCWDVEEPKNLLYSSKTSAYNVFGSCRVLRYIFFGLRLEAVMLTSQSAAYRR